MRIFLETFSLWLGTTDKESNFVVGGLKSANGSLVDPAIGPSRCYGSPRRSNRAPRPVLAELVCFGQAKRASCIAITAQPCARPQRFRPRILAGTSYRWETEEHKPHPSAEMPPHLVGYGMLHSQSPYSTVVIGVLKLARDFARSECFPARLELRRPRD